MKTLPANLPMARQLRGMTLVELMVALVLGLLLTAGMIQVFAGNRVTYAFNDSLSRIQENGRFAVDHIAFNTRMAGYSGCLSDVNVYNNLSTPDSFRDDIRNGLLGHDANGTSAGETFVAASSYPAPSANAADWTPALPADLVNRALPGSDVMIVRSVGGSSHSLVTPFSDSSQLFVSHPHDFVLGEILVVTDCQKASIFQLTNVTLTGSSVNLVHSNDGKYTPGNTSPTWGDEQSYGLGSEIARLQAFAFYIGQGTNNSPSLFQLRLQTQTGTFAGFLPEELVSNIESMQLRYGVDGDSNGSIDSFVSADAVADWARVLSVELTLLGRASDEYGTDIDTTVYNLSGTQFNPIDDRRLRQVFSTTVGVRNRLP